MHSWIKSDARFSQSCDDQPEFCIEADIALLGMLYAGYRSPS